ncbi:MAG TPA: efflux RND transporter permease subunit [Geminicoccus sp.]|uniref:efflux RND transporter permease subunit n=1 Tax=Geminicoccus sp. TaxID=2024832 RepID=UPI002B79B838|nr:efflux RND transporter permease subunit [Geminicoccus sp.]HWL68782.1 efflux RND transporter permease subunit [Geminicoccus sp.]
MNISAVWIRRPALTIVVSLIPAILGLFALTRVEIRDLPRFDIPLIQIVTALPGGAPEQIASRITVPIEQAVATVGNVDTVISRSEAGLSSVQVTFQFGVDSVGAANQVQSAISQILGQLPAEAERPVISRLSLDNVPVLYLSLASETMSEVDLSDLAARVVVPQLSTVQGVGSIQVIGDRRPVMAVTVDPTNLQAMGVSASDIAAAIQQRNTDVPAGDVASESGRTSIQLGATDDPVAAVAKVVVRRNGDQVVRLGDVGDVQITGEDSTTRVQINGQSAVALGIMRQSTANSLVLAQALRDAIPQLQSVLPPDVQIAVAFDTTLSISASLDEVRDSLLIAIGLVILVVFAFLGSLRSSLITLVTIPLSLLTTVVFIYFIGFSFNTFTLLAFILAIGLVVDDAIVDVENVQRHIDEGLSPIDAAFVGSAEIGFAIIATTITLASLYVPIGLAPGMLGALFREFGLTLAVAVLISGVISRTLSPMMCSRLLRPTRSNFYSRAIDHGFDWLVHGYRGLLRRLLGSRLAVGLLAITVLAVGGLAGSTLQGEFAPAEDEGYLLVQLDAPTNATADYLVRHAAAVEKVFDTVPEKSGSLIILGIPASNQGYAFLLLEDWEARERSAREIGESIRAELGAIAGLGTTLIPPDPLSGAQAQPLQLVIKGPMGYEALARVADRILAKAQGDPAISAPSVDLSFDLPQIDLEVDEALAADRGVDVQSIAGALRMLFGGYDVDRFSWQGELYKIQLELERAFAERPESIGLVGVRAGDGRLVPLDTFVSVEISAGASFLPRFNQLASAQISADAGPGFSTGSALDRLTALAQAELEPGMQIDYNGASRQLKQANAADGAVFLLGIVFIFLTLTAQFESFRDPCIVLLVVPLSIAGAIVALALFGGSLNVYSGIGFITLVGLIAKHGILITEFANQLRDRGVELREAVIESAALRLRPILMTTLAMVLGSVPLLFATGAGAVSRMNIGLVLVGGLVVGTLLALFVVPVVYTLITRKIRQPHVEISKGAEERLEEMGLG